MVEEKDWAAFPRAGPRLGLWGRRPPPCVVSLLLDLLKECALMVFLEWTCPCWYLASTQNGCECICFFVYVNISMCVHKVVQIWVHCTINTLLHWQTVLNYFVFCINYLFRGKILPCSLGGSILWLSYLGLQNLTSVMFCNDNIVF